MSCTRIGIVGVLLTFCVPLSIAHGDDPDALALAKNGRTTYRIAVAEDASPRVKAVAQDFQSIFREMTGATIPMITDRQPMGPREIIIGPSKHLDNLAMYIDWDALGEEGYVIRTHGGRLALFGGPVGGTRNAVYTFLDEHLGCRFYGRDLNFIPKKGDLTIGILHVEEVPYLEARNPNAAWVGDPMWALRNRVNMFYDQAVHWLYETETFQEETEAWKNFANDPRLAGFWLFAGAPDRRPRHNDELHTFNPDMLVPSSLFEEHPDYFALRKGLHDDKRHPDNGICPTAPGLVELVARNAKDWIRQAPFARIISISMVDRYYACGCPRCVERYRKDADKYVYVQPVTPDGKPTRPSRNRWTAGNAREGGVFLDFVNQVTDEIHKEFPDIYVHTFAYYWTRYPTEGWMPTDKLIIDMEPLVECRYHSLAQCEHNEEVYGFWTCLRRWTKKSPHVWVWDDCYGYSVKPSPLFKHRNLYYRELRVAGVKGVLAHMCGGADQWIGELRAYVYAKLMWNADYDINAGIAEYCTHAYGAAAEPMLQYIRETQDPSNYFGPDWSSGGGYDEVPGFHEIGYGSTPVAHVKPEVLARWGKLFDEAEEAVANDEAALARVGVQHRSHKRYMEQRQKTK